MKPETVKINPSLPFQFIGVDDTGPESGACCPHCGADGRYIYQWYEYGVKRAAMAGCYAGLTGLIKKSDVDKHIERIAVKQSRKKTLNGWDKTIVRMLDYKSTNANDAGKVSWAEMKIQQAVSESKQYSFRRH